MVDREILRFAAMHIAVRYTQDDNGEYKSRKDLLPMELTLGSHGSAGLTMTLLFSAHGSTGLTMTLLSWVGGIMTQALVIFGNGNNG